MTHPTLRLVSFRALPVLAALACAFFAPGAHAQIIINYNGAPVTTPITFGQADCQLPRQIAFSWVLDSQYNGGPVTVVATTTQPTAQAACPTGHAEGSGIGAANSASMPVTDFLSTAASADGGTAGQGCNTPATSASPGVAYFCVSYPVTSLFGGTSTSVSASVTVNYALQPPSPPISLQTSTGDSHVKLSWSPATSSDQIATYDAYAVPTTTPATPIDLAHPSSSPTSAQADISKTDDGASLQNGVTYDFAVRGTDSYGNTSGISTRVHETPIQIDDFYNRYRNEGGSAAGGNGCSTGGGAGLLGTVLALLLLRLLTLRRRRAQVAAATLVAGFFFAALPARADLSDLDTKHRASTTRHALFALKIDRYDPHIDSEKGLKGTPYHDIFHGRAPLRWQLEVDWEIAHPFGSFLLGGTAGFWQNIGRGLVHSTGLRSDDTALLDIAPLSAIATYRFDWLADRFRWLPIIPYAQAGLSTALWTSYAGNGKVSRGTSSAGGRGSGWSYGYTTAVGFALALDAFTPDISNEGRVDLGLKRSSLFAEYGWTRLDDFRHHHPLILSDRAWRFGLSLEF